MRQQEKIQMKALLGAGRNQRLVIARGESITAVLGNLQPFFSLKVVRICLFLDDDVCGDVKRAV
jgi:hypothetical protein